MAEQVQDDNINPEEPEVVQDEPAVTPEPDTKPDTSDEGTTDSAEEKPEDDSDKAEESPDTEPDTEEEDTGSKYNEYDHPALQQAVRLLEDAEVSVEDANALFAEAVEANDLSKVNKDALVEKVGQDKADVIMVLAESYMTTTLNAYKAVTDVAHDITGGEENFNSMREWAQNQEANNPEFAKDMQEIRDLLDSGKPRAIKAAINELFDLYKADPNTTIAADLTVGDNAVGSAGVDPLSRSDYINAIDTARREGNYEQVHKQLWARRQAGIKQGI